jgi:hypothetical protein
VVLCDISGSMERYSRMLLLFAHAVMRRRPRVVEAFVFSTDLTRVTRQMRQRRPDAALAAMSRHVPDWSGGTRIGAALKEFNDVWGRRALTRGAVVLVVSDGWERQDPELVGEQMRRLHRAAYAIVWVNPLKGGTDYEPLGAGMRAALPHVDRFVAGHNVASLDALGQLVAGIRRRHEA